MKKSKKQVLSEVFEGKKRTREEVYQEIWENGNYCVPKIIYVKFLNGCFTLRDDHEHKHYYGNYQVRFGGGAEVFPIMRMQYDLHFNKYQIIVPAGILDEDTAGFFNRCYPQYYQVGENAFIFNADECVLMKDDKTLKGEKYEEDK